MASNPQHEPTMEEILASIRKIISEDSNEGQPAEAPKPAVAPAPAAAVVESDVLELTQEVEEPAQKPAPQADMARPAPVAAAPHPGNDDVEFRTIEEPAPASEAHSDIFSDRTRKAVDDAFAKLEPEREESRSMPTGPMPSIDGATVEAVFERAVRDSFGPVMKDYLHTNTDEIIARMKPLIREWMDEHFPALLEGAVRNEVERAVKARGRR